MTDFTRAEIRSQLNMQGFDPPEPEFTEVVYRINALIEGLCSDVLLFVRGVIVVLRSHSQPEPAHHPPD